jgi:hypothetical protein
MHLNHSGMLSLIANEMKKFIANNHINELFNMRNMTREQGRIGSPNFGGIFFQEASKKNCCRNKITDQKTKKRVIK